MASYADDIRRIAKQKGLKGGIGDLQPRDPIPGTVTPFDASLFAQANDNSTNPSNKTPEATDGNNPNTFNKGDGSGGDGTSGGSRSTNGPQDADDILDDKAGPTLPDSNVSDVFSGGVLTALKNLHDCDTGKCVSVYLDGNPPPPDGWDSVDSLPKDPTWEPGIFWHPYICLLASSTKNRAALAFFNSRGGVNGGPTLGGTPPYSYGYDDTNPEILKTEIYSSAGDVVKAAFFYKFHCTVANNICPSKHSELCPDSAPPDYNASWPQDNCYEISYKDGSFSASQYDADAPDSAKKPAAAVTYCTQSGRKVKISPASAGGTIVREVNNLGAAIGIVRVYNSDGTLRGAGDAAWIDSQKPR